MQEVIEEFGLAVILLMLGEVFIRMVTQFV